MQTKMQILAAAKLITGFELSSNYNKTNYWTLGRRLMTVLTMGIMETFQNKRTKTIKELRTRREQNRWRLRHLAEFKRFKSLKNCV